MTAMKKEDADNHDNNDDDDDDKAFLLALAMMRLRCAFLLFQVPTTYYVLPVLCASCVAPSRNTSRHMYSSQTNKTSTRNPNLVSTPPTLLQKPRKSTGFTCTVAKSFREEALLEYFLNTLSPKP